MDDLIISDDKNKLDIELIHKFLTTSYWAEGRTLEEVKNSIEHSSTQFALEFIKMISKSALQEL